MSKIRNFTSVFIILTLFLLSSQNDDEYDYDVEDSTRQEPSGYMRKEYSLIKPFNTMQHWEIVGSTMVTGDHLRLTPDEPSMKGSTWNILPCFVRNWEIHIHFKIHGYGTRLFGDGMAFWYTKERAMPGPVFGNKDYFTGLGILLDTYANQNGEHEHEHPYISAQVSNGSIHYDHDRDGTHTQLAGCSSQFRGVDSETYIAIRYLGSQKRLTIQYDTDDGDIWTSCFDKYNVELPTGYYFGLSAQTGDLSDMHDVIGVKFYELDNPEDDNGDYSKIIPSAKDAEPEREHTEDPAKPRTRRQTAFNWFIVLLLVVMVTGGLGYYFYYKKQQEDNKRFY